VERPVFVIGNFRSGTTFLQRLLARDRHNFTVMRTWEIYAAPTVSQRKFMRGLSLVDRWFGGPLHRILAAWEGRTLERIPLHRVGLHEAEEDEGLFLHVWSSLFVWFLFPVPDVSLPFGRFDHQLKPSQRRRIMRYYRQCIQRHLYAHGRSGRYLAKNPSASPRVASLEETFPDAQFIYLARDPRKMLPSKLAWFAFCFRYFNTPVAACPFCREIVEMAFHWYTYPVKWLTARPDRGLVLRFDELIARTPETLRRIYLFLRTPLEAATFEAMKAAADEAHRKAPNRRHTLEQWGLSRARIDEEFASVLRLFHFQ
jgi:hypothetical protein